MYRLIIFADFWVFGRNVAQITQSELSAAGSISDKLVLCDLSEGISPRRERERGKCLPDRYLEEGCKLGLCAPLSFFMLKHNMMIAIGLASRNISGILRF